uniref:Protein-arginine deiminase (PAD) middle domain-containing protein n=1 Tax=Candidatus Kentrum sp. LPFa TaxID=2126335 RepID=A0A450X1S8_9GAMM|nr:MAG: Protein-arginine deiminase (PAD) middle domain-containing protein [Candidatus Kentron sp. LPFa]VFK35271.1 MAG: Protein-arginine deiminase (PAD) middle domain-containing protein [Candidatus Kentron sp. LPFa]
MKDDKKSKIKIRIDANRDGKVDDGEIGRQNWVWGEGQYGAILIADKDNDSEYSTSVACICR